MKKSFLFIIITIILLAPLSFDFAEAARTTAVRTSERSVRILPTSRFYPVKRTWERVNVGLTPNPVKRATKELYYAGTRLYEARAVAERYPQNTRAINTALEGYINLQGSVQKRIADLPKTANIQPFLNQTAEHFVTSQTILNKFKLAAESTLDTVEKAKSSLITTLAAGHFTVTVTGDAGTLAGDAVTVTFAGGAGTLLAGDDTAPLTDIFVKGPLITPTPPTTPLTVTVTDSAGNTATATFTVTEPSLPTPPPAPPCTPSWSCTEWGRWGWCEGNDPQAQSQSRKRKCTDVNNCRTYDYKKPHEIEYRMCDRDCIESWSCSDWGPWGVCVDNRFQNRIRKCADANQCGTAKNRPDEYEERACTTTSPIPIPSPAPPVEPTPPPPTPTLVPTLTSIPAQTPNTKPVIESISSKSISPGQEFIINGKNFTTGRNIKQVTEVFVGTVAAKFYVLDSLSIFVTAPYVQAGFYDVSITVSSGEKLVLPKALEIKNLPQ